MSRTPCFLLRQFLNLLNALCGAQRWGMLRQSQNRKISPCLTSFLQEMLYLKRIRESTHFLKMPFLFLEDMIYVLGRNGLILPLICTLPSPFPSLWDISAIGLPTCRAEMRPLSVPWRCGSHGCHHCWGTETKLRTFNLNAVSFRWELVLLSSGKHHSAYSRSSHRVCFPKPQMR